MKILLVHNYYQHQGGTDDYVNALNKLLKSKGHEVLLYKENSILINTFSEKIHVGFNLISSKNNRINVIVNKFQPDICHINNIFPKINFSVIKLCKEKHIPIVQTFHDFRYIFLDGIYNEKGGINLLKNYILGILNKSYHNSYLASIFLAISLI